VTFEGVWAGLVRRSDGSFDCLTLTLGVQGDALEGWGVLGEEPASLVAGRVEEEEASFSFASEVEADFSYSDIFVCRFDMNGNLRGEQIGIAGVIGTLELEKFDMNKALVSDDGPIGCRGSENGRLK